MTSLTSLMRYTMVCIVLKCLLLIMYSIFLNYTHLNLFSSSHRKQMLAIIRLRIMKSLMRVMKVYSFVLLKKCVGSTAFAHITVFQLRNSTLKSSATRQT